MSNQDAGIDSPSDIDDLASGGPVQPEPSPDSFALIASTAHRVLDPICRYLCYAAAIVTLLMAIGMVVDLVSRLVFRSPLTGMIELQTFMLVIMAFFSIAYTMLKNQHVAVDLITSVLPDHVNSFLQSIFCIWGAFIKVFGRLPGGLAIGTVAGCGGFAAICGESVAAAATMGSVSIPEMKKYNYDDSLATGSVAAGGTLGILIPPSIGFVVYGIITEQSIGKMFMAGIIPGIILVVGFALAVYVQCRINPNLGPKAPKATRSEIMWSIIDVWPVALLFAAVIGGIYSGILTSTEAGGIGASGALLIALFAPGFNRHKLFAALLEATQTSAMIFTILIGVGLLGYIVTLTDIPLAFANFLKGLDVSRYVIYVLILLLYLVLGMVMNIIPMMMLTLPILFLTVVGLGFDPIWFGVIMVIMMEMGQITPPIGINVFVIHGVAKKYNISMATIYRGIIPFVIVEILVIILLTIFPEITLWLPNSMDVLAPLD